MRIKISNFFHLAFACLLIAESTLAADKTSVANNEELFREHLIKIDDSTLDRWARAKSGSTISLPWFDSSYLQVDVLSVTVNRKLITMVGSVGSKKTGHVVLVIGQKKLAGAVTLETENYRIWPAASAGNNYALFEVNSGQLPEFPDTQTLTNHFENKPGKLSSQEDKNRYVVDSDIENLELAQSEANGEVKYIRIEDGSRVDILIAYSSESLAWAQRHNINIDLAIELMIGTTNLHFVTSGIHTRLNLVGTTEINHTVLDPKLELDLNALATRYGTYYDLHTLRNSLKADLVSFLVLNGEQGCKIEDGTICGLARLANRYMVPGDFPGTNFNGTTTWDSDFASDGFSVVSIYNAFHDHTFTHEIGHNLGAGHDRWAHYYVNGSPTAETRARGWIMLDIQTRTVMSYNTMCKQHGFNCNRLPLFSNPQMTIGSAPQGDPVAGNLPAYLGPADNVSVINKMARTVANYRQRFVTP